MDYKKKYMKYKIKYNSIKKLFGGAAYNPHPPDYPNSDPKTLKYKISNRDKEIIYCMKQEN